MNPFRPAPTRRDPAQALIRAHLLMAAIDAGAIVGFLLFFRPLTP